MHRAAKRLLGETPSCTYKTRTEGRNVLNIYI